MKDIIKLLIINALLFIVVFAGTLESFAQPKGGMRPSFIIKGEVSDQISGAPLEFATVTLRSKGDSANVTGSITGSDGTFRIEDLRPGKYGLEINFLGYEKIVKDIFLNPRETPTISDVGKFELKPSAQLLKAAEVTADKSFMMNNIDRKTFNTDQLTVATGGNVNDILQVIPSVEVDNEGTVSLRGSENVTILIDGKPSGLTGAGGSSLLESIPASSIEKVEVITNPSAKYDPDGVAGILNIITKKNKLEGFTGTVEANTSFEFGYGGNLQLNYMYGKWNLSTSYAYNKRIRDRKATTYSETLLNDVTNFYDQEGSSESDRTSHNVRFNIDYNLSDQTTLSTGIVVNTGDRSSDESNNYLYTNNFGDIDSLYKRFSSNSGDNFNVDFDLSLRHNFKEPGRLLSLLLTSSFDDGESGINYQQIPYMDIDNSYPESNWTNERDFTINENKIYTVGADYEHPIGESMKFEAGIKSTIRDLTTDYRFERLNNSDGVYYNDSNRTNTFLYNDIVNAIYAQWRQSMGRFGYQVGIRAEQANNESDLATTGEVFKNDYFNVYPSAFVSWQLDEKTQIKASYSKRINRPRTRQLNPFTDYEDPLNLREGNPYLEPEYSNSFEAEVSRYVGKLSLSLTWYYRYTFDRIQRYKYFLDDGSGVSVLTYENIDNAKFYGIDWAINGSPWKWWNLTLSGSTYRNDIDATNISSGLSSSGFAWSARIFSNFKLPQNFEFQLSYYYRGAYTVPQGELQPMQFLNVAVSKKVLNERGTLTFKANDPFNLSEFSIDVKDQNFTQDIYRKWRSQIFTVAFKYRFGELKQRSGRSRGGRGDSGGDMDMDF